MLFCAIFVHIVSIMGKKTKAELIAMNDSLTQELETQRNAFADFKKQQEEELSKLKLLLQQATNGIASTSSETPEQKQAREAAVREEQRKEEEEQKKKDEEEARRLALEKKALAEKVGEIAKSLQEVRGQIKMVEHAEVKLKEKSGNPGHF